MTQAQMASRVRASSRERNRNGLLDVPQPAAPPAAADAAARRNFRRFMKVATPDCNRFQAVRKPSLARSLRYDRREVVMAGKKGHVSKIVENAGMHGIHSKAARGRKSTGQTEIGRASCRERV